MPAVTVDNLLVLPRVMLPAVSTSPDRPVARVVSAPAQVEGAGFTIHRPFPGPVTMAQADPFLLLDHMGPQLNGPHETVGAPWHPHRGFETVTYVLDGEVVHHDSNGGGGTIREGDTQWMTAGNGILHDELPSERMWRLGGPVHAVQLWVNLPGRLKLTAPRYQAITAENLVLLTNGDGGALIRVIAGDLAGFAGPGATHTPITYLHATIAPGGQLILPWPADFSAMVYVLTGSGTVTDQHHPITDHHLAVLGRGERITLRAAASGQPMDVLVLGGLPIQEPIWHHGPFVMNTREEISTAIEDFAAGRLGIIPADQLQPRDFGDTPTDSSASSNS
jgi:quercetin 2,3-dioxygenase